MCNPRQAGVPSMNVIHFGKQNFPVVMLLHGGGLSWWNYREAAALLQNRYHVILPILDGHAGSDADFVSIQENARRIIRYIDEYLGGQTMFLGGVSLGAQIAAEILAIRPDICRCALLESALVRPMKLTHALIPAVFGISYGLIRQKWFARLQAAYLGIPKSLFEDYFRDTSAITKSNLITFLQSNSVYRINDGLGNTTARVKIVAGARELPAMHASARLLHNAVPGSDLEMLPGFSHGELSLCHPQKYIQLLQSLMDSV